MTDIIDDNMKDERATDSFVARQISQEILNFGISQNQLINLIQMLAMELESRNLMVNINTCIENSLEKTVGSSSKEESDLIRDV